MLILTGLALAEPWVVQLPEQPTPQQVAWVEGHGGTRLIPPSQRRKDPEGFRALGLDRFWRLDVPADTVVPDGLPWAAPAGVGFAHAAPNDPEFIWQWGLHNDGKTWDGAVAGADVDAVAGWDLHTGGGVVVAILDSGVPLLEEDLALWTNEGEVADDGLDNDGNGYVDDVYGWDFHYGDNDPSDVNGHGSNVAGIAAALGDNGVGYSGACQGCVVMGLKNLNDSSYGYYADWAESLIYAVDHGADVVNMSEGGYSYDLALDLAVVYAYDNGVPVFVSMGNDDSDRWDVFPSNVPEAIGVGATDWADRRASPFQWGGGSNWGDHISLVAPGDKIYGLSPYPGEYSWSWSGTSQASPLAAGIGALLKSVEPDLSPDEVRAYLEEGADDLVGDTAEDVEGWDRYMGHGRVNATASLSLVMADVADVDGDGVDLRAGDCDDEDAARAPEAEELCDGLDNDCDELVPDDEADGDGDGWLACEECDDGDAATFPGAEEVLDDGVDQDCSGSDAVTCFYDGDGDGVGAGELVGEDGDCDDAWEAAVGGDCDDGDAAYTDDCPVEDTAPPVDTGDGDTAAPEERDDEEPGGCGCGGGGAGFWLLGLAVVAGRRRRAYSPVGASQLERMSSNSASVVR